VDELSVKQAAEQLAVSQIQVGRLIGSGELRAQRFGRAWAVDRKSVQRYSAMRSGRGRPLPPASAWQKVLNAHPRSISEVLDLARQARRRGSRIAGAIGPGKFPALFADDRIVRSGVVAAAHHGAAVDENPPHVVYFKRSDAEAVMSQYPIAQEHSLPNIVAWIIEDAFWPFDAPVAPIELALVDLVGEGDYRSARELLSEVSA
jgi:excisionase family DNA binding protein